VTLEERLTSKDNLIIMGITLILLVFLVWFSSCYGRGGFDPIVKTTSCSTLAAAAKTKTEHEFKEYIDKHDARLIGTIVSCLRHEIRSDIE